MSLPTLATTASDGGYTNFDIDIDCEHCISVYGFVLGESFINHLDYYVLHLSWSLISVPYHLHYRELIIVREQHLLEMVLMHPVIFFLLVLPNIIMNAYWMFIKLLKKIMEFL